MKKYCYYCIRQNVVFAKFSTTFNNEKFKELYNSVRRTLALELETIEKRIDDEITWTIRTKKTGRNFKCGVQGGC